MRQVPRQWSPLDRKLKLIQSSAERIAGFAALARDHGASDSEGVAAMLVSCCEVALQGEPVLSLLLLDSLLSVLHRVGAILQHVKLSVPTESGKFSSSCSQKLYTALAKMMQALQRICASFVEMFDQLRETGKSLTVAVFTYQVNKYFEADISSLKEASGEVCQQVWQPTYKDSTMESSHGRVVDWLDDQIDYVAARGRSGHRYGFSRDLPVGDSVTPFVFDFVESLVLEFFKTPQRMLIVTGELGYGEQQLTANLLERLQLTLAVDSKLLRGTFGGSLLALHNYLQTDNIDGKRTVFSQGPTSGTVAFLKSLLR